MCNGRPCGRCTPQNNIGNPGRGIPGATPTITFEFDALPAGSDPTVVVGGTQLNPNYTVGFPLAPSAEFNPVVNVTNGTAGGNASASIDNTDPLVPQLNLLLIPGQPGDNGYNGISPITILVTSFNMPAVNASTDGLTVSDTRGFVEGDWVAVGGAGVVGYDIGYMVVSSIGSDTTLRLRNPGNDDGISAGNGYLNGLPFNVTVGTPVVPTGALNQLAVAGRPGARGARGVSVYVIVGDTPPIGPPVDGFTLVFVTDVLPPGRATSFVPYTWDPVGSTWDAGPNIAGAPGNQTFTGTSDPNIVPVSGSNVGDLYWRMAAGVSTLYSRISLATWSAIGAIPSAGSITQEITSPAIAPISEVLDLSYFSINITTDKDLDLDWTNSNFDDVCSCKNEFFYHFSGHYIPCNNGFIGKIFSCSLHKFDEIF